MKDLKFPVTAFIRTLPSELSSTAVTSAMEKRDLPSHQRDTQPTFGQRTDAELARPRR